MIPGPRDSNQQAAAAPALSYPNDRVSAEPWPPVVGLSGNRDLDPRK
jgi:hypothetical protein